jgi:putative drug exporter of the RND superfamily
VLGAKVWAHSKWFEKHVPDVDIEGTKLEASEDQLAASR